MLYDLMILQDSEMTVGNPAAISCFHAETLTLLIALLHFYLLKEEHHIGM